MKISNETKFQVQFSETVTLSTFLPLWVPIEWSAGLKKLHVHVNKPNRLQLINIVTCTLFTVFVSYSKRWETVGSVTVFSEKRSKKSKMRKISEFFLIFNFISRKKNYLSQRRGFHIFWEMKWCNISEILWTKKRAQKILNKIWRFYLKKNLIHQKIIIVYNFRPKTKLFMCQCTVCCFFVLLYTLFLAQKISLRRKLMVFCKNHFLFLKTISLC